MDEEARASRRLRRTAGDTWALGALSGAAILGCALRVAAARGDLWLDEAWSLQLVRPLGSAAEVFYGISHDNNHFLNSLWLFWLGQDQPPWAYRVPAVCLGTLSALLASAIVWPRSRAGAVAAAVLVAAAFPFVNYGSEARGYGGLIAAILLAILAFERAIDAAPGSRRARQARWLLGIAVGLGALFHLTMVMTLAVLGLAALMHFKADRSLPRALDATLALLRPALIGLIPAAVAVAAGIVHTGAFRLGGDMPALPGSLLRGYGDQMRFILGLPADVPLSLCCVCAGIVLLAALRLSRPAPARQALIFSAAVVLPAGMLLLHLPNLQMCRYYMVSGIVLLLAVADLVGSLWDRGRSGPRLGAAALFGLILFGQARADIAALALQRGRYGEALAAMADPAGHVSYATHDLFLFDTVAERVARSRHLTLDRVPDADVCRRQPQWFVDVAMDADDPAARTVALGSPACAAHYALDRTLRSNPLSGMRWDIYRREG